MITPTVILDTNILVASGFNRNSHSSQIVEQVRSGLRRMIWTEQTHEEAQIIIRKIPPLSWDNIAVLFRIENCYSGALPLEQFQQIPDPADIKFVALSNATGVPLITVGSRILVERKELSLALLKM